MVKTTPPRTCNEKVHPASHPLLNSGQVKGGGIQARGTGWHGESNQGKTEGPYRSEKEQRGATQILYKASEPQKAACTDLFCWLNDWLAYF
jgi:hypothetical protein